MKIRTDYVSNSSSSSFIIHLDKPIDEYSKEEFMNKFETYRALNTVWENLQAEYANTGERNLSFDMDDSDYPMEVKMLNIEADKNSDVVTTYII